MTLGDQGEQFKKDWFSNRFFPGQIFHLHCNFITPPKEKFLILACCEPKPLFFFINSGVHRFVQADQDLSRCQVVIDAKSHTFLNYDSYVDCREPIDRFTREDVESQVLNSMDRIKCAITDGVKNEILSAIKFSPLMNAREVGWVVDSLE